MQYPWYYLFIINAISLLLMLLDKLLAKKHLRRIPEAVLLGTAILGGSLGATLGMLLFRHKTKHLLFLIGLPVLLIAQIGLLLY